MKKFEVNYDIVDGDNWTRTHYQKVIELEIKADDVRKEIKDYLESQLFFPFDTIDLNWFKEVK